MAYTFDKFLDNMFCDYMQNDQVTKANVTDARFLCSVWFSVADDVCLPHVGRWLYTNLACMRLLPLIQATAGYADSFISAISSVNWRDSDVTPLSVVTMASATAEWPASLTLALETDISNMADIHDTYKVVERILLVLRFPKRFSYRVDDRPLTAARDAFLEINQRHYHPYDGVPRSSQEGVDRCFSYSPHSTLRDWVIQGMKEYFASYDWTPLYEAVNGDNAALTRRITPGAVSDLRAKKGERVTTYKKVVKICSEVPYLYSVEYGTDPYLYATQLKANHDYYWNREPWKLIPAKVAIVPKTYKIGRTIVEFNTTRQWYASGVRSALEEIAQASCPGVSTEAADNRELCLWSSTYGYYATVDWSSASDSISEQVCREVLPAEVYDILRDLHPHRLTIYDKEKKQRLTLSANVFFLSGGSDTWIFESIFFWTLSRVCLDIVGTLTGVNYPDPLMHGDDTELASVAVHVLEEAGRLLGMKMNLDKSFYTGFFRESCGVDALDGYALDNLYYPRGGIAVSAAMNSKDPECNNALSAIVELQHALVQRGLRNAAKVCEDLVLSIFPKMTYHTIGEPCSDLWCDDLDLACGELSISTRRYCKGIEVDSNGARRIIPLTKKDPVPETAVSYKHYSLVAKVNNTFYQQLLAESSALTDVREWHNAELYLYVEYLLHGPAYESELDRLLGVSQSRRKSLLRDCATEGTEWRLTE